MTKVYRPGASMSSDYIYICNYCEIDAGVPYIFWPESDFSLCLECVRKLYMEHVAGIDKEGERIIVKRPSISEGLRNKIIKKSGGKCPTCNSRENLTIDHIIPFSANGNTDESNLQTLCRSCNSRKGARIEN